MGSVEDLEIFIPDHSHILTLPVGSLPPSISRKLVVCPGVPERPATFICPVEVRQKGATPRPRPLTPGPRPLTPGPIRLPVVTSNSRAMETLRNFLRGGEISPCCSAESSCSSFSRRKNSIILFNSNIFLIQPKSQRSDWLHQRPNSAPLEHEAPPTKTSNGGSKDGAVAAEDHGKCTLQETDAAVTEGKQEVLLKDASTNTARIKLERAELASQQGRANHMTSASANQITTSKNPGGEATSRKRAFFPAPPISSDSNANQSPVQNKVKGQIRDPEIRGVNADKPEPAKAASYVTVQSRGGQSSLMVTDGPNRGVNPNSAEPGTDGPVPLLRSDSGAWPGAAPQLETDDGKVTNSRGHQDHDRAHGVKRRNQDKVGGASAKRHKPEVEVAPTFEGEWLKYVDPKAQVQNDVRIIKVNEEEEEEEEEEETVLVNGANCGTSELPEHHHVSRSDGAETKAVSEVAVEVQRIRAEDVSAPGNLSEQKDVLMKVPPCSSEDERLWSEREVLTAKPRPHDQVLRGPEPCDGEGPVDCDIREDLKKKASDEEEAASSEEKISSGSCLESHDVDGVGPTVAPERNEWTARPSGATNQSAHREDASLLFPRPTSSSGKQQMEYVVLNREENINLMREKIRRIQEEISNLRSLKH